MQVPATAMNDNFSTQPGRFMIEMDDTQAVQPGNMKWDENSSDMMHKAFFWIVALGDFDATTNKYPWAVISSPFGLNLFIMARDIDEFQSKYEDQVLKMVHDKGFKFVFNKPIKSFQSTTECNYPPTTRPAPPVPPTTETA